MTDQPEPLCDVMNLAGFALAHAVWRMSEGESLDAIVIVEKGEDRELIRFAAEELEDGVAAAETFLSENPEQVDRATLIRDGTVTLGGARSDALQLEAVDYVHGSAQILLRYRPATETEALAVHTPTLQFDPRGDGDAAIEAFFAGMDAHAQGSEAYDDCLIEEG